MDDAENGMDDSVHGGGGGGGDGGFGGFGVGFGVSGGGASILGVVNAVHQQQGRHRYGASSTFSSSSSSSESSESELKSL